MRVSARATAHVVFLVILSVASVVSAVPLMVDGLRCEHRDNPLGVDVSRPRLSWRLASNERGQRQSAYRILVASSLDMLAQDRGDLWDSGKVASNATLQVAYDGAPLASRMPCWWKVQVWDTDDAPSAWSEPAAWTMGLLSPEDWGGTWISAQGLYEAQGALTLDGAKWIWCAADSHESSDADEAFPEGARYFRRSFTVPKGKQVKAAAIALSADNTWRLYVNGRFAWQSSTKPEAWRRPQRIDIAERLTEGVNSLAVRAVNTAPGAAGLIAKARLLFDDGSSMEIVSDASWQSAAEEAEGWKRTDFAGDSWSAAHELGAFGCKPWGRLDVTTRRVLPMFRREFHVDKLIKRALAFICGLGFHELSINGQRIGDHMLEPGWTNYRKTCLYATYDVTASLQQGANALGVMLGNGMYNVPGGRYVKYTGSFGVPKLMAQVYVEFEDGTTTQMTTDGSWKAAPSPITFTCIYGGEDYDARLEQDGWNRPGFDDSGWTAAAPAAGPGGQLVAQSAPPIKVIETFEAVTVTEPKPGVYVYDLGQNHSGWPCVTVRGAKGAEVKLTPGELLDQNGLVTQRSSGGPSFFTYTLKGEGQETWRPRFTYYGYRYVQVEGASRDFSATERPVIVNLEGQFVHASAERVGRFECSNPLFTRIHEVIVAAIRSNMQSVMTDCPHREKLGWLEITHLLGPAIFYNFNVPTLYGKIISDMSEAQLDNGLVPDIAPEYVVFNGGFRDSPEWGSAYVINPWLLRRWYGDQATLEAHYEGMKRYVEYLRSRSEGHIVSHGLGDWCDLGPGPSGYAQLTPMPLTATAIYYWDICILAETARMLGRGDDAAHYEALAREVRDAFNGKFLDADTGQYATASQTANAMPLVLGLAGEKQQGGLLEHIVEDVRTRGNQVTAGDVGHRFLLMALGEGGRSDVIFDMTNHTDRPGYGYQVARGVTTLAESWDANPGMSHNHFMLGHIEEWFYKHLAGIQQEPDSIGFERIVIKPQIVGDITWVKASYDSVRGPIRSEWALMEAGWRLDVCIPPNTTATVYVPAHDAATVTEGGKIAGEAKGVTFLRMESGRAVYRVESGSYTFVSGKSRD